MGRKKKVIDPVVEVKKFVNLAVNKHGTNKNLYIGIDPGSKGAIAFLYGQYQCVIDIPVMQVRRGKKNKTAFVLPTIVAVFKQIAPIFDKRNVFVALEEAQVGIPGKGNSAYNGFRVGCGYGMWPLFFLSKGWALEEGIRPNIWKGKMGLKGQDKEASRFKALNMYPHVAESLKRKQDHDRAEALLLATYLKRIIHKGQ